MEKTYTELKDIAKNELKKLVKKGELSATEMEAAKNAASLIEKIDKICEQEMYEEEGYSQRRMGGYSYKDDPYRRWEIMSYRDGHGTDSSMGYPYYPMTYSRTGSDYSRHSIKDRSIAVLENLMNKAGSDYERQKIQDYIRKVESAE